MVAPVSVETQKDEGIGQSQRQDQVPHCEWPSPSRTVLMSWHMVLSTSEPLAPDSSPHRVPWSLLFWASCPHNGPLFTCSSSFRTSLQAPSQSRVALENLPLPPHNLWLPGQPGSSAWEFLFHVEFPEIPTLKQP